ncbi:30S ribosomal protein S4 [bacterium]|nr:30S ribosomal protein S4 [bacterium]
MARDLSPKCKQCRREGRKLFLKGERCYTSKCALTRRKYPPGFHGPKGYPRQSEYSLELRQKQQLRRFYGILEAQLKNYFEKAKKQQGDIGENLLCLLEERLDNVVWRAGFAISRREARQLVNHGNILVNERRVDIPSYQVKVGDLVKVKPKQRIVKKVKQNIEKVLSLDERSKVSWLSLDKDNLEVKVLSQPKPEDLPKDFNLRLIVQFYSR